MSGIVSFQLTILTFANSLSTYLGRNIKFYRNLKSICHEMSLRLRVLNLVEIVLRVPPLFVIDEILKVGLGIQALSHQEFPLFEENYYKTSSQNFTTVSQYNPLLYKVVVFGLIRLILSAIGEFFQH